MNLLKRIGRHLRLVRTNYQTLPTPPFLVLFINSICNMKCEHCFYWTSLNKKDDLSMDEMVELSRSLGRIENLNLSGGEPFLRPEFSEICRQFIRQNRVRQIYVPTNGYFTARTVQQVAETLEEPGLDLFAVELSLDGMPRFHDTFRVARDSFKKAMQTYDALVELQERDPRLRIHCISTATGVNIEEIRRLSTYLFDRCPRMDHHNLAIIRGDRKNRSLLAPPLEEYTALYEYISRLWASREEGRYGGIVEPMLQWAKVETIKQERQVIPCRAGRLSAVVYANGDVGVCELHAPLGNLRQKSFPEIWSSAEARTLRQCVSNNECHCTTEVFLWPSFTYPPLQLARTLVSASALKRVKPLEFADRVRIDVDPATRLPQEAVDVEVREVPGEESSEVAIDDQFGPARLAEVDDAKDIDRI